eukprot:TRINITY_DN109125_c0_g1_i1.p1 TRINITY_DN109125_c0_g1~~TRINITY_DN109125_c0_g1_i1.p1  ORF type:complete len:376 (-),score=50.91 TRINITY_DN109125_c0_g1_i1:98-1141(-)
MSQDPLRHSMPTAFPSSENLRAPQTQGTLTSGRFRQPDLDQFGFGDDSMQMGPPSRAVPSSSPHMFASPSQFPEGDTNSDRFRKLCLLNDAILYEDELIQIGLKAEYTGLDGQLAVFFGNKGNAPLESFTVQYFVREEHAMRLVTSPIAQHLEADKQIVQRLQVTLLEPFVECPWLRLQFLLPDASPRRIQMKFPVVLPKFMVGRDLTPQEFFRQWRLQHFVLNEVTNIVHLAERLKGPLVHIARSIVFGGALRLHHGVDSNPDNFVLVSQLANSHGREGVDPHSADPTDRGLSLIRVEVGSGRFTGKARVVVRSSDHVTAKALCECIVMQLSEANAPNSGKVGMGR